MNTATANQTTFQPGVPRPGPSHLCTRGGVVAGTGEKCPHCLSAKTLRLAAEMKAVLSTGHRPCGAVRSALSTLLPAIRRVVEGVVS